MLLIGPRVVIIKLVIIVIIIVKIMCVTGITNSVQCLLLLLINEHCVAVTRTFVLVIVHIQCIQSDIQFFVYEVFKQYVIS